jgi:acyl-CoA thioesterase-1
MTLLTVLVVAAENTASGQPQPRRAPHPAFAPVTDDPQLPRVLLIGDSISIGYTVAVRERLAGKANVHRIPVNGGPTTRGLSDMDVWLGDRKWDVIHFNWGLHDLKYIDAQGKLVDVSRGRQQVPIDEYEKNLESLVQRLRQTGARLIWRSTTPVPAGAEGRAPEDAPRYNEVAARIMQRHGIPIDDQYTFALPRLAEIQLPANVHFTEEGSRQLGAQAAAAIARALAEQE